MTMLKRIKGLIRRVRQLKTVTIYAREYELLKKAAFGDLKERMNATKELRRFTTEALRNENGL
ncbi:MAG: hypothetical protein IJS26_05570 [Alphaproteobacteria bacterium]|nr:hypothetical protein [Alphaproteobacteria bacterium]